MSDKPGLSMTEAARGAEALAAAIREAMDDGEAAWRSANSPTPEWGWDALPEDERNEWRS